MDTVSTLIDRLLDYMNDTTIPETVLTVCTNSCSPHDSEEDAEPYLHVGPHKKKPQHLNNHEDKTDDIETSDENEQTQTNNPQSKPTPNPNPPSIKHSISNAIPITSQSINTTNNIDTMASSSLRSIPIHYSISKSIDTDINKTELEASSGNNHTHSYASNHKPLSIEISNIEPIRRNAVCTQPTAKGAISIEIASVDEKECNALPSKSITKPMSIEITATHHPEHEHLRSQFQNNQRSKSNITFTGSSVEYAHEADHNEDIPVTDYSSKPLSIEVTEPLNRWSLSRDIKLKQSHTISATNLMPLPVTYRKDSYAEDVQSLKSMKLPRQPPSPFIHQSSSHNDNDDEKEFLFKNDDDRIGARVLPRTSLTRPPTLHKGLSAARSIRFGSSTRSISTSQQSIRLSIASHRESILSVSGYNNNDNEENKEEQDGMSNYGFGIGFSYHSNYPFYPYVAAKYSNLKEELLQNDICNIDVATYAEIAKKGKELQVRIQSDDLLGSNAFAKDDEYWNDMFGIEPETKISLQHVLSIIFYTDLTELPKEMKFACRKLRNDEPMDSVCFLEQKYVFLNKRYIQNIYILW